MRPTRSLATPFFVIPCLALAALLPGEASAQNFFEELFGIGRGAKPPVPPRGVPTAPPPGVPVPGTPLPEDPSAPAAEAPRPAAPSKPVVLKAPSEEGVVGQELMLNGLTGSLKLERAGSGLTARITLPGTKVSQPAEACKVPLGGPVALTNEGKPEGVPRYEAAAAECPLRFDVTEGGVLVSSLGPTPLCTFSGLDCATAPVGLWGPAATGLLPRSSEFDSARGVADKAVRENYKVMTQRARREDVRPIVTEQAAFSSDREQLCRSYAREGAHGFCHLRVTENRALALATRLGASTSAAAPTVAATPRPRRKPAVEGMNPDAGSAGAPQAE